MGIKRTLLAQTLQVIKVDSVSACERDLLYDYGCNRDEITDFLLGARPFLDRQQRAMEIIKGIMTWHGKQDLLKYVRRRDEWELNVDARKEFESMRESGKVCHGMLSALALLYLLDLMYRKYNPAREYTDICAPGDNVSWNQTYFEEHIIPACAAVFVHNLPGKCFRNGKIKRTGAPLAFLLRLSDCLQEWERPSLSDSTGLTTDQFDVEIQSGTLVFRASVPEDRKKKIEAAIHSCLEAPDVKIV